MASVPPFGATLLQVVDTICNARLRMVAPPENLLFRRFFRLNPDGPDSAHSAFTKGRDRFFLKNLGVHLFQLGLAQTTAGGASALRGSRTCVG